TLLDVVWHPLRPIIVSLSNTPNKEQVSIWAQPQVQNWSAFAPDFKELDENVEYEERESEFDMEDEDKKVEDSNEKQEEDVDVDIETVEPVPTLLSSDEEQEPEDVLMYLSITPEVENPEEVQTFDESMMQSSENSAANRKRTSLVGESKKTRTLSTTSEGESQPQQKRPNVQIDLPNAATDEVHPLLGNSRRQNPKSSGVLGISDAGEDQESTDSGGKKSVNRQNSSRSNKVRK
ncbi:hypothetical protein Ciccas_011642, partial [Cichlidogyrus casuarinus]